MVRPTPHSIVAALLLIAVAGVAAAAAMDGGKRIPQPVIEGLKLAPDQARRDLVLPGFSNPTKITNPHFPVSQQESVLLLGKVDGKPFRTEVTLLPYTRIIEWEGVRIEAAVSQYVAYLDGHIEEVATDLYAQANDGSVWYLGEDVSDFRDGAIVTKEGTWIAGLQGPPAMIMPANPKVGDAFRTENWPGIAFEEVTIKAVNQTFDGPFGPIKNGVAGTELHFGGSTEDKQFAPGYGEFLTANADGDVEALALAVPANRATGPMPVELRQLTKSAMEIVDKAKSRNWVVTAAALHMLQDAHGRVATTEVPRLMKPVLSDALSKLALAVGRRDDRATSQAAIETARLGYDLQLRYRSAREIDAARLDLWAAQLQLDAAAGNAGAVRGDTFTLLLIADRMIRSLDAATVQKINLLFGELQPAATDGELAAAGNIAARLRALIAALPAASR